MRLERSLLLALSTLGGLVVAVSQTANPQSANNPHKHVPVEQHPFTVELKTTTVQMLANGTTITRESTEIHAEDSQFRNFLSNTRAIPFSDRHESMTSVHITDPVEGTQIDWNSQRQEATVVKLPPADQQHGCWQSESGHMNAHYGEPRPASGSGGGKSVAGSSIETSTVGASSRVAPNQAADIGSPGIGAIAGTRATAPAVPPRAHRSSQGEDLGTATIEGLEVHGQRYTHTIPAGQIGNDEPLVSTTEAWTAPSLGGLALRTVNDDPLNGKSTTEVVRLDMSEPPLSTFQPPEGYEVIVEEMHQVPCKEPGRP